MAESRSGGEARRRAPTTLWVLAAVYALAFAAAYAFYVRSGVGQRLDEAGFFGRDGMEPRLIGEAESLLGAVELTVLASILALLVLLAFWRGRLDLAAAVVAMVAGSNLTTQVLKLGILERPHLVPDFYRLANSYPSGHVTAVASLAMAAVLVSTRRVRPVVAGIGAAAAFVVGVSAVTAGWHRPSDVMGAWLVVGTWAAISAGSLLALRGGGDARPVTRLGARTEAVLWMLGGAALATFVVVSGAWAALVWSEAADGGGSRGGLALVASLSGMAAAALLVPTSIAAGTRRHALAPEWLGRA
jgi:membrane-associated phospholipid phosphatase